MTSATTYGPTPLSKLPQILSNPHTHSSTTPYALSLSHSHTLTRQEPCMYCHGNYSGTPSTSRNELSYYFPADFLTHFSLPDGHLANMPSSDFQPNPCSPPTPLVIPAYGELDSLTALNSEFGYTTSSGCSSYDSPTSYTSYNETHCPSMMQRSMSSQTLIQKKVNKLFHRLICSPTTELYGSEGSSVRRVYSAGDLQGINLGQLSHCSGSPLSNESNSSIIESMSKACRYSPEEKKERIDKYRRKRTQRNFNKKIKYVCRKTLADSRPRIRGRFARNDEIEKAPQNQWNHQGVEEYYDKEEDTWINLLDSFSASLNP